MLLTNITILQSLKPGWIRRYWENYFQFDLSETDMDGYISTEAISKLNLKDLAKPMSKKKPSMWTVFLTKQQLKR